MKRFNRRVRTAPADFSVDDIHDLRVTTRRLRASLSVLRQCADIKTERKARRELRALGRALGVRRMLDIAIRDAEAYGADVKPLRKRCARAQTGLKRALRAKRVDPLLEQLSQLGEVVAGTSFERLVWWLQELEWEVAYLIKRRPRTLEARHQLRIQLKKVRYVLEAFGRRSARLEKLQDHLGREHDLAVLQTMIGKKREVARDERRAGVAADKAMVPALRSALKNLQTLRRDLVR